MLYAYYGTPFKNHNKQKFFYECVKVKPKTRQHTARHFKIFSFLGMPSSTLKLKTGAKK